MLQGRWDRGVLLHAVVVQLIMAYLLLRSAAVAVSADVIL
jgi:hypothetical protein